MPVTQGLCPQGDSTLLKKAGRKGGRNRILNSIIQPSDKSTSFPNVAFSDNYIDLLGSYITLTDLYINSSDIISTCQISLLLSVCQRPFIYHYKCVTSQYKDHTSKQEISTRRH